MVSLMQRRREMMQMSGGGGVPGIDAYVTNGIMLWFDGIQNTRSGHDATSLYWHDLSGGGRDYPYASANTVHDSYCDINGQGAVVITGAPGQSFTDAIKFVEAVVDQDGETGVQLIMGIGNVLGTTYVKSNAVCFQGNSKLRSVPSASGVHYYNSELYRDGEVVTAANISESWSTAVFRGNGRLFAYSSNTSYPFRGHLYALRVYNRVLTADEIQQNWLADKARFGI